MNFMNRERILSTLFFGTKIGVLRGLAMILLSYFVKSPDTEVVSSPF